MIREVFKKAGKKLAEDFKMRFSKRTLSIHMGTDKIMDIVVDPKTAKLSFRPRNGKFKISDDKLEFGKRKTTVMIQI
jgi:hypothetical protein